MPAASRTIDIAAPIETVFAFFTNPANDRKWRAAVKEMRAEGEPRVGGKVHQVIAGPGGRSINADIEITEYAVPTRYAFKTVGGPVRPEGGYTFEQTVTGTKVMFTLDAELTGLKKFFMSGPVQKSMLGEVSGLEKAKALLEQ